MIHGIIPENVGDVDSGYRLVVVGNVCRQHVFNVQNNVCVVSSENKHANSTLFLLKPRSGGVRVSPCFSRVTAVVF